MNKQRAFFVFFMIFFVGFAAVEAHSQEDIAKHRFCEWCGMDRKAYGFSRVLLVYTDGSERGLCSLHCAARDIAVNPERRIKTLFVADRNSRILIDAEKAVWVIGGAKRGVMSDIPKWAFEAKSSAEAFTEQYGGEIVSWEKALSSALDEIAVGK